MVKKFQSVLLSFLREHWILLLILAIAIFFRTYKVIERFDFAHDGDLFSWIVKDIVVDGHPRLIGQQTTAPGIFIGPMFYYMLVPFFLLFRMDPIGAVIPIILIGVATVFSYYCVFTKIFNKTVGLITSFLYASLLVSVNFDLRVVPSTPTNIWLIWYFYTVMMLARGNYSVFPFLGFLAGLIWHIHIALAPALVAVPLAMIAARKLLTIKQLIIAAIAFLIPSIPLILFETRHGFSQTLSFVRDLGINHGGGMGLAKLQLILIKVSDNISRLLFYPQGVPINKILFMALLLLLAVWLVYKKLLKTKEVFIFYGWIGAVFLYYTASSAIISEYYFANIEIIFLAIVSIFLYFLLKSSRIGKVLVIILLAVILGKNSYHHITRSHYLQGYNERKAVAQFIAQDSRKRGFPCVSVSYVTRPGENVGFRHFFWLNNLHVNQPASGAPVYTIVLPSELVVDALAAKYGQIGVITPERIPGMEEIRKSCSGENANLTDPMTGFTK